MKRASTHIEWSACAALVLAFAAGNLSCTCTLIGCTSNETLAVHVPLSADELESAQVTACRNGRCWSGSLVNLNVDWSMYARIGIPVTEDAPAPSDEARASLSAAREVNGFSLEFEWQARDYRDVKAGDTLGFTLRNRALVELLNLEAHVATTSDDYPNGKDCDKHPCRSAKLDVRGP